MELEKRYVPVTVHFDAGGKMRPIEIEFDETRKYHIDKILDISPSVYISAQTPHGIDIANWYVLNYLYLLLS